jgi:hypothetical protein
VNDDDIKTRWQLADEYHRLNRLSDDIDRWKAAHDGEKPDLLVGLHAITLDRWIEIFIGWEPNRLELHRPN